MERRQRWERGTTFPLIALGVAFVVCYVTVILVVGEPTWVSVLLTAVILISWAAFIVDVVVRVVLTPRGGRWEFVRNHPIDVGSAILPVFRALKVVDLLRGLPWLHGRTPSAIRFEVVIYALAYVAVFVVFVALAALEAERAAPGATITDFPEALWWAATSLTTGGYGEVYPVTWPGRLYAVLLMTSGLVLFGVAAGVTGSYVFERTRNLGKPDAE